MKNAIRFPKGKPSTAHSQDMRMGEWDTMPTVIIENQMSFGKDFNLIRAVEEHGPLRIEAIDKEVAVLEQKMRALLDEKIVLARLVDAIHSENRT